jgi:hypothetical protein
MQVVIDTVSIQHLLRCLKPSKIKKHMHSRQLVETSLDGPLKKRFITLAVDLYGGLVDEWARTCGHEPIRVLIMKWESYGAILSVEPEKKIGPKISRKLRQFGFNDTIDRLILRIAMVTEERIVVSDDSDFWDPREPRNKGIHNAPVAKLCREELGIIIFLLDGLMKRILTKR